VLVYDDKSDKYYSLEKEERPVYYATEDRYRVRGILRPL